MPLCDIDCKTIDSMIYVNLIAPIKITKKLINILDQVININSMVGIEAKKNRTLYAASKWGLKGFSDSLKLESNKCRILDVYPTNIKTWPDRQNAMDIEFVLDKISNAVESGESELILDGRNKKLTNLKEFKEKGYLIIDNFLEITDYSLMFEKFSQNKKTGRELTKKEIITNKEVLSKWSLNIFQITMKNIFCKAGEPRSLS